MRDALCQEAKWHFLFFLFEKLVFLTKIVYLGLIRIYLEIIGFYLGITVNHFNFKSPKITNLPKTETLLNMV